VSYGWCVAADDVNGDDLPDIYLLRRGSTGNQPDLVCLNNGSGNNCTQMSVPSTTQGDAESVWHIDKNGLTEISSSQRSHESRASAAHSVLSCLSLKPPIVEETP
jgi:hypothetical protein